MQGTVVFVLSVLVLIFAIGWAVCVKKMKYKRGRLLTPFNIIFGGVSLSAMLLFIPIYSQMFGNAEYGIGKMLLLSIHNTIRLFIVDGEFSIIMDNLGVITEEVQDVYTTFAAILFVIAPFLTFGFVLSFFKNVSAYKDYYFKYYSEVYVFSELNEQALALARSLKKNQKKRTVVFTDVFESEDERIYELMAQAYELGAIMFKKDIALVNFGFHSKKSKITFFIIGQDDDENVKQSLSLIHRYQNNDNAQLYVFTTSVNSELLLSESMTGNMKVRRINEVQSLISRQLFDEGIEIFETAVDCGDSEKLISAVIVGMGQHGMEMTKALAWFCQMDGYRLEVNVFDADKKAESRLCHECPELMDEKHNHDFTTVGESHYSIKVHSGVDVGTKEFLEMTEQIKNITYVFIALGDDERNISMAVKLRSWFLKSGNFPKMDVVVRNADKKNALQGIKNYSGQEYKIHFIGDTASSYSEEVIFESDIEKEALARHMKWGKEEEFWRFEYNYRSSIASAIHGKMKVLCRIPGIEKIPEERTDSEKRIIRQLEHRRWNAYMRSEGFSYAEKRNNLAKTHHCLVPFDELSLKEQEKDDD